MDWPIVGPLIGAVAALTAAITQAARLTGDRTWYRRWLEVLEHAQTEAERKIARERIDHYVVEFAVTDRTRKKRRDALAVAAILIAFSLVLWTGGMLVFSAATTGGGWPFTVVGWILVAIALAGYFLALYLIVFFPDKERSHAREEVRQEAADASERPNKRRWRRKRRPRDS